jgi:uncharacterized tellurite resistance protein B-like protein
MKISKSSTIAELLAAIKEELDRTINSYEQARDLRAKKIEQDLKQVDVYLDILQNRSESARLNERSLRRINGLLTWSPKTRGKQKAYSKQQDQLEKHLIELQKLLVGLLSKRFKY